MTGFKRACKVPATMTATEIIMLLGLAIEVGFIFGWIIQDYRYAGKEVRRVMQDFEETKQRFTV